jgi:hypothetical protein
MCGEGGGEGGREGLEIKEYSFFYYYFAEGTLWHLLKFLKYIILEFTPSIIFQNTGFKWYLVKLFLDLFCKLVCRSQYN